MGKKTKIFWMFKHRGGSSLLTVPLCHNAKTLSFRVGDHVTKTVRSASFNHQNNGDSLEAETPDSWFTNSSESASYSTESDQDLDAESLERVVRDVVKSERLLFEPAITSSILIEKDEDSNRRSKGKNLDRPPLEDIAVAVEMESEDPYGDFRRSMEEMVTSHKELAKDWGSLETMLRLYLRMNGKRSHGMIMSAFVDLLVNNAGSGNNPAKASVSESTHYSTAVSSVPSPPPLYSSRGQNEIEEVGEEEGRTNYRKNN